MYATKIGIINSLVASAGNRKRVLHFYAKPKTQHMSYNSPDGLDNDSYMIPKHWHDKEDLPQSAFKKKPKNEQKSPLFIFLKHAISEMTLENTSRTERYVNSYCRMESPTEEDRTEIKTMFQNKLKTL